MREFHVCQISDTHLSRFSLKLTENFRRVSEHIDATRPDIVINTGDLTFDALTNRDDLAFAKALHNDLPVACRCLPGNHDIGDNPTEFGPPTEQPVTEETRQYFVSVIGEDRWSFDAAGWRFIGLNSMVMNSGLACEAEQFDWLTSQLSATGSKPVALFLHKPFYLSTPDDPELAATSSRYVPQPARRRVIELLDAINLRLVASGHIHQRRDFTRGHVRHVWAPSTAFIIRDMRQELIGTKEVGLVEYRFEPDGFDVHHVRAQGQIDIKSHSPWIRTAYRARKIYASYLRRTSQSEIHSEAARIMERDPEKWKLLERWKQALHSRHTVATFQDGGRLAVQVAADLSRTIQDLEEVANARANARSEAGTPLMADIASVVTEALSQGVPEASLLSAIRSSVSSLQATLQKRGPRMFLSYAREDIRVVTRIARADPDPCTGR